MKDVPANERVTDAAPPMIFLFGPPGSGKSTLGGTACRALGLRFLDLPVDQDPLAALEEAVRTRAADVVALPWAPDHDGPWLVFCRRSGETLALWAHPLEMQARSGRTEALFTPVGRLTTRGGFGRHGTSCREYRHLDRACSRVLDLGGLSLEEAAEEVREWIHGLRTPREGTAAQQVGIQGWARHWQGDYDANPDACRIILDAMARFIMQLQKDGASPRKISAVCDDLNAAGCLVMGYEAPGPKKVLDAFSCVSWTYEYERKFSDSPASVKRFTSTWEAFARFLEESGLVDNS